MSRSTPKIALAPDKAPTPENAAWFFDGTAMMVACLMSIDLDERENPPLGRIAQHLLQAAINTVTDLGVTPEQQVAILQRALASFGLEGEVLSVPKRRVD